MMKQKYFLILGIVIIGLISVFLLVNKSGPASQSITEELFVELKIHDSVPKSLVIQNDGTVIFKEGNKSNQIRVSSEEIKALKQCILDNNFFSLKKEYADKNLLDAVGHTITITIGNKTHSVYCYCSCPKEFGNILKKIKSLWPYEIHYVEFHEKLKSSPTLTSSLSLGLFEEYNSNLTVRFLAESSKIAYVK